MFCTVRLELELPFSSSLKDKRQTLRSLKDRLRRKNVSAGGVGSPRAMAARHRWRSHSPQSRAGAAEEKREELRKMLLTYEELSILDWREEFVKL